MWYALTSIHFRILSWVRFKFSFHWNIANVKREKYIVELVSNSYLPWSILKDFSCRFWISHTVFKGRSTACIVECRKSYLLSKSNFKKCVLKFTCSIETIKRKLNIAHCGEDDFCLLNVARISTNSWTQFTNINMYGTSNKIFAHVYHCQRVITINI